MTITRIANFAATPPLVNLVLRTQARVNESQIQVASEKKSQTYSGIAGESERLINIENSRNLLDQFVQNNNLEDIRLSTTDTVFEAIRKAISDFREQVFLYEGGGLDVEQRVKDVQDAAFRALKDIETHLNQDFNGRFLFGGTRVTTQPVDLGLTTLAEFQTTYDGTTVVYPVTLEPVREFLLQMFMGEKFGRDSIWETHLAEELWLTDVGLQAVLDEQVMRLQDVFDLKVGTQIMLNATPESLANLRCGEVSMYTGKMGRKGDRIAIQIENRVEKQKDRP